MMEMFTDGLINLSTLKINHSGQEFLQTKVNYVNKCFFTIFNIKGDSKQPTTPMIEAEVGKYFYIEDEGASSC